MRKIDEEQLAAEVFDASVSDLQYFQKRLQHHNMQKETAPTIPAQVALFNNNVELWAGARSHYKEHGKFLIIAEGHIFVSGDGIVARFESDEAAARCLFDAGYSKESSEINIIFKP